MVASSTFKKVKKYIVEHKRILFSCCGNSDGPFVILSGGIHGNEPSGVLALNNVFTEIVKLNIRVQGSVLAFIGNRNALNSGQRYAKIDLNRLWTDENLKKLHSTGFDENELNPDIVEMIKIDELIQEFENTASGKEHYFVDLHTTSAPSVPFAVVNRNDHCIEMALKFPLPVVINMNEYIPGTMLNYFNNQGFYGLVFEAGQHDDPMSVTKHEAIIWLVLAETGAIYRESIPDYYAKYDLLNGLSDDPHKKFQIIHREGIVEGQQFEMKPGFVNFQSIQRSDYVGSKNGHDLHAPKSGRMFMPLYQSKGTDGYFIVERIS